MCHTHHRGKHLLTISKLYVHVKWSMHTFKVLFPPVTEIVRLNKSFMGGEEKQVCLIILPENNKQILKVKCRVCIRIVTVFLTRFTSHLFS